MCSTAAARICRRMTGRASGNRDETERERVDVKAQILPQITSYYVCMCTLLWHLAAGHHRVHARECVSTLV